MALKNHHVIFAAISVFVAWGLAARWAPTLRYLGYAFVAGTFITILAIATLILSTSSGGGSNQSERKRAPRTAAFVELHVWNEEAAWLSNRAVYAPAPIYPPSQAISNALDELLNWLLRDLITTWYSKIIKSPNFIHEIDHVIRVALINIRDRIFSVDIVETAISRITPIITSHLKDFYQAERAIRGKHLNRLVTESEELDLAIAGKYRDGKLHPAASLAFSDAKIVQQEHLRTIVARLLPEILPESVIKSRVMMVFTKEILSCAILSPLMQILSDPDTWNLLMETYGRTMLQDRKSVRKLRAALDQHASPAPKSIKVGTLPRLSPNDDERKFERFVRAIRQCNNLSEARRFRSEVASQLKREHMEEDQDQAYLRRLETGKSLLDQRVDKLSSARGSSHARPPQHDLGNGYASSGRADATITDILHDASGLSYFMEYMDRQQLMTLVQFWIVVDGFREPLEEDVMTDDSLSTSRPHWTDADRAYLAQIYESYLSKPELKVSEESREAVRSFLKAGKSATMAQYLGARSVILRAQSTVLEHMREQCFPNFKRSDLYYKYLISDDSSTRTANRAQSNASKVPLEDEVQETPQKPPHKSRASSRFNLSDRDLRRNASSHNDLKSFAKASEPALHSQPRQPLEVSASTPLFDDDILNEALARSTNSLDSELFGADREDGNREKMVEAMEAALNDIMTDDKKDDEPTKSLFESSDSHHFRREVDSPRSSEDFVRVEAAVNERGRERPNLASLGLVNTSSRIGVFTDNDLFDDEEKFIEDERADSEGSTEEKGPDDEIHQAAPGDLGLAEAISVLALDIERLVAQESVVDTLTRKAELTNNVAELRILEKSKSSLQREMRRKELQRQQYIVQESDNSLYGRATVEIKSIMVGKEDDGQEFALYVVEVHRKAGEHMAAASWAVARRYSEFHDLHHRLRSIYPAVRHLDFPRRRLVMKLQREFLHRRRVSLENYLQELLRIPAVCRSRDVRAFLSQQAIISTADTGRAGERQDIVSRIYNSVTDGMDDFLGNLPVLDQLSIAGQNLISAATSQFNTTISPTTSTVPDEEGSHTPHSAEAQAELLAFESRDVEDQPFVKPICDLFLEAFDLNRGNNWLRGRAVVVVLHQLLGGTIERKLRDAAHALAAEASVLKSIAWLKTILWPAGGHTSRLRTDTARALRTDAQKAHSRREASVLLATLIPDLAGNVVGRGNAQAAGRRVFASMNNPRLNTHLAFSVLDEVLAVLFPGVERERGRTSA